MNEFAELVTQEFATRIAGSFSDREAALKAVRILLRFVLKLETITEPDAPLPVDLVPTLPCGCPAPKELLAMVEPLRRLDQSVRALRPEGAFILLVGSPVDDEPTMTYSTLHSVPNILHIIHDAAENLEASQIPHDPKDCN